MGNLSRYKKLYTCNSLGTSLVLEISRLKAYLALFTHTHNQLNDDDGTNGKTTMMVQATISMVTWICT